MWSVNLVCVDHAELQDKIGQAHPSRGDENLGHDKQRRMITPVGEWFKCATASPSVVQSVERVEGVRSLVVSHPRARRDPVQRTQPYPMDPATARPRSYAG